MIVAPSRPSGMLLPLDVLRLELFQAAVGLKDRFASAFANSLL